jgi:hypothetical protein
LYGGAYDSEVTPRYIFLNCAPSFGRLVIAYSVEVKYGWPVMNMQLLADNDDDDYDYYYDNRNHNNNKNNKKKKQI